MVAEVWHLLNQDAEGSRVIWTSSFSKAQTSVERYQSGCYDGKLTWKVGGRKKVFSQSRLGPNIFRDERASSRSASAQCGCWEERVLWRPHPPCQGYYFPEEKGFIRYENFPFLWEALLPNIFCFCFCTFVSTVYIYTKFLPWASVGVAFKGIESRAMWTKNKLHKCQDRF